jgi:REP element-mobilizing transposase RayT
VRGGRIPPSGDLWEVMTRPRSQLPDGPFHVMSHSVELGVLFADDVDRRRYLALLRHVAERHRWSVLTFVLMDTHVHMLIWTTAEQLSAGMYWLDWWYAASFKERRPGHRGPVFGWSFKSKPIRTERHLHAVVRYVARNPVAAGMVRRADDHWWSADRLLRAGSPNLEFLAVDRTLSLFRDDPAHYAAFVDGEDPPEHHRVVRFAEGGPEDRPALDDLLADPSDAALARAHQVWGYTFQEIAGELGVHHTTVMRRIARAAQSAQG